MESNEVSVCDCRKCGSNQVYWSVKNSTWYCARCQFYRGEANNIQIVKEETMSKKQRAPIELVEKMMSVQGGLKQPILAEHCAQIALEHAEEENRELIDGYTELFNLLEEHQPNWYTRGHYFKAKQLLNKTEDGKE